MRFRFPLLAGALDVEFAIYASHNEHGEQRVPNLFAGFRWCCICCSYEPSVVDV